MEEFKCTNLPYLELMKTSKAVQEEMKSELISYSLSPTEFSVLEVILRNGRQTIHQIAKSILISSGTMTYVIDKLEKRNLLKRNPCPDDRRIIHMTLTQAGMNLMKDIMPKYDAFLNSMFNCLEHEESGQLMKLLKKIRENIKH